MPKGTSPIIKACPLISEDFGIPNDLDIPTCSEHNFREKRLVKIIPSLNDHIIHRMSSRRINLEIFPDSNTKIAVDD